MGDGGKCGNPIAQRENTGSRCALPVDHKGRHRSPQSVDRAKARYGTPGERERNRRYRQSISGKAALLHGEARRRASKKSLPFNLTVEWVEGELREAVSRGCPYLGIQIRLDCGFGDPASPTIDQFIPGAGYTQDNCIIVSRKANAIKNDASVSELQQVASSVNRLSRTRFKESVNG